MTGSDVSAGATRRARVRIVVFVLVLAALSASVAIWHGRLPGPERIHGAADELGLLGQVIAVPVAVGLKMILFPSSVVTVAAGLLFGPALGMLVMSTAAAIAACLQLVVSRRVARGASAADRAGRLGAFDAFIERRGWLAIVCLRLVPISHNLVNYSTGFTSLRMSHMALGTFFGSMPMAFAYAYLGGHLHDSGSAQFRIALAALLVLGIIGIVLGRSDLARAPAPVEE